MTQQVATRPRKHALVFHLVLLVSASAAIPANAQASSTDPVDAFFDGRTYKIGDKVLPIMGLEYFRVKVPKFKISVGGTKYTIPEVTASGSKFLVPDEVHGVLGATRPVYASCSDNCEIVRAPNGEGLLVVTAGGYQWLLLDSDLSVFRISTNDVYKGRIVNYQPPAETPVPTCSPATSQVNDARTGPLIADLGDADPSVRLSAATALGTISDPRAAEPLITALKDADLLVRFKSAEALGSIKDPRAVGPLIDALKDAAPSVRHAAAAALGSIKDSRAMGPLTDELGDPDSGVRQMAAYSLNQIYACGGK